MTDASFDRSYALEHSIGGPTEPVAEEPQASPYDVGLEMMFYGAQCVRLGRDIIANISAVNHELAVGWLERHLESRFRIHRVRELSDSHIDSMVLALRSGLLLLRSEEVMGYLPEQHRSWDRTVPPPPEANNFPQYEDDDLGVCLAAASTASSWTPFRDGGVEDYFN